MQRFDRLMLKVTSAVKLDKIAKLVQLDKNYIVYQRILRQSEITELHNVK